MNWEILHLFPVSLGTNSDREAWQATLPRARAMPGPDRTAYIPASEKLFRTGPCVRSNHNIDSNG
jgi:hypothetical protein